MALCVGYKLKKALNEIIFRILLIKFSYKFWTFSLKISLLQIANRFSLPCQKLQIFERNGKFLYGHSSFFSFIFNLYYRQTG
jgi:hypothetical protein